MKKIISLLVCGLFSYQVVAQTMQDNNMTQKKEALEAEVEKVENAINNNLKKSPATVELTPVSTENSTLKKVKTTNESALQKIEQSKDKEVKKLAELQEKYISSKSKEDFKLKPHHAKRQFECQHCHEGQGDDWKNYKPLVTEDCLTCHTSAKKVANRTKFMDINYTNPHNSIHDKLDLDCQTCHNEHKPSQSLCTSCHDNTKEWFKEAP